LELCITLNAADTPALLAVSLLLCLWCCSLWWCALLAYIGAFTLPAAYMASKDSLEATVKSIRAATIVRVRSTVLPTAV
jgi:hypothetical protein